MDYFRQYPETFLVGLTKPRNTSVRTVGVPAEIRTEHYPDTEYGIAQSV
jgi:hypothetical protein